MTSFVNAFKHIRELPSTFWFIVLATFLNQAGNMAMVFLMPYLHLHLGFSLSQAAFLFAMLSFSMLMSGLIGGSLVDRFGAARVLLISLAINGFTILCIPHFQSFLSVFMMISLWGTAFGIFRPASQTFVSYLSKSGNYKLTFSLYRWAINLGMSIGPAVAGYLILYSYDTIFYVNAAVNFGACMIIFFSLLPTSWLRYRANKETKVDFALKWLKKDKRLLWFVIGMVPVSMVFFQHESTLPIFLQQSLHLPLSFYGWLFTLNTLLIVTCEIPLNIATLNWSYRTNFLLGSICITGGFALLYFVHSAVGVIGLAILWTIGEMIFYPAVSSYMADIAPLEHRGSYMSISSTCSNLGMLLGPWAGANIMAVMGSQGLWMICGLWGMMSLVTYSRSQEPGNFRAENATLPVNPS